MTSSHSFRLSAAALVVLALPVLTSAVNRCDGQETGRGVDVLQAARDAQQAAERKATGRVLVAELRAALIVPFAPDEAVELLKRVREEVRDDPNLSEDCRQRLNAHLEWTLRGVCRCGAVVKQKMAEWHRVSEYYRVRLQNWEFVLDLLLGKG